MADYPVLPGLYGFRWGPMTVVRATEHDGYVALDIHGSGKKITVYVSPAGRSIRVFGDGGEWKPTADA